MSRLPTYGYGYVKRPLVQLRHYFYIIRTLKINHQYLTCTAKCNLVTFLTVRKNNLLIHLRKDMHVAASIILVITQ